MESNANNLDKKEVVADGAEKNIDTEQVAQAMTDVLKNPVLNESSTAENAPINQPDDGKNVNLPAEKHERGEIVGLEEVNTHALSAEVGAKYLPVERAQSIVNQLREIDHLVNTETIEKLSIDQLTPVDLANQNALQTLGIYAGKMTPKELQRVTDYVRTATPEIELEKVYAIQGTISRQINGQHRRRDQDGGPARQRALATLSDKFERWENGEIDTSRGFDEGVLRNTGEEYGRVSSDFDEAASDYHDGDYYEKQSDRKYYIDSYYDNLDIDELIEAGIIDEDDRLVYGPFSSRDLDTIYDLTVPTYVSPLNFRYHTRLKELLTASAGVSKESDSGLSEDEADLFGVEEADADSIESAVTPAVAFVQETIPSRADTVDQRLNYAFISQEILKERRLDARNMIGLASAIGREVPATMPEVLEAKISEKEGSIGALRRQLSLVAYYSAQVCGFTKAELRKNYGSTRPISAAFFEEAAARAESWTEQQAATINEDESAFLIKLDDRMFELERAYANMLLNKRGGSSNRKALAAQDGAEA